MIDRNSTTQNERIENEENFEDAEATEAVSIIRRRWGRSERLIALFKNGYAEGWAFAVAEAFRDALDIKLTDKVIGRKKMQIWTQGQQFGFSLGDVLYNDRLAYRDFDAFLKGSNPVALQVMATQSCGFVDKRVYDVLGEQIKYQITSASGTKEKIAVSFQIRDQAFEQGNIKFDVRRPNSTRTKLVTTETLNMGNDEFIAFLQTGERYNADANRSVYYQYDVLPTMESQVDLPLA
jgi:hypothetical protein